ncbi:Na+ channel auxiliary subunit TipE [Trinorchestia longiramus]|nr:Na+ channel auxiliary subunit TipE [Trinorchestia longiramus]
MADFDPDPVVCKTVFSEHIFGMKNCSWSSCKIGCTVDQYECDRIFVNYMAKKYDDFEGTEYYEDDDDIWVAKGVPIFVNIKGCGYPPATNCTIYADEYGPVGSIFPCYYSRAKPNLVITEYSWEGAVHPMIMALILPNLITGVSLGVLSYWWYPGCQKKENSYEIPPDQQSQQDGDDEEKEGDEKSDDGSHGSEKKRPSETKIDIMAEEEKKINSLAAVEEKKV